MSIMKASFAGLDTIEEIGNDTAALDAHFEEISHALHNYADGTAGETTEAVTEFDQRKAKFMEELRQSLITVSGQSTESLEGTNARDAHAGANLLG